MANSTTSTRGRPSVPKDENGKSTETPAQAWRRSATVRFNNALRALEGLSTLARNPELDVRKSHKEGTNPDSGKPFLTVAQQWSALEKRLDKAFVAMREAYAERIANPDAKVTKIVEREDIPE